ncbi:catalase [Pseudochelatococcus contaminans]|uniref:Catalase n=1 Tax=Pseudochelatococcus contaminans TaxID=1538103 RepID=A0A7W5Z2Y4_9HYPH|nr:catalase [Pseudochelatococcus contaminans]MBB3809140.1 catalase [Pseudochelatococcus contaminans]
MTDSRFTTTTAGAPVASDEFSRTVGPDGPVLLHDVYLLEKLAQFNRERVPERVVHAKGGGAFGVLTVTEDVSRYTRAALFQPGTQTDMLIRFSSVAGELGSPDTWRDVRGFAMKFYTSEGNYDLVGNNTPVFFIRDGIKFPDFIRSQKRLSDTHLRDADMQWDFWTLSPESAHQVTYLMGDRGLPESWRHLNGYGSHTYQWINAAGERFWVKYHFHNQQGERNITGDEAEKIAGADSDHYLRDLFDAIERGDFPKWTVSVQIMPYEDARTYRFNPFDLTKVWPHGDYPLIRVGEFVLNRNPENYFAQIEQAAFEPSNLVPGIDVSPDKMLLARVFSYADAHRYRIGSNYNELPVNRPKAPVHSYAKDGHLRHVWAEPKQPVYAPNSLGGPKADPARAAEGPGWQTDGELIRSAYTLRQDDDDFGQAGALIRDVFTDEQRARFVDTLVGQYNSLTRDAVKERFLWYWTSIDKTTGERIRARVLSSGKAEADKAVRAPDLVSAPVGA